MNGVGLCTLWPVEKYGDWQPQVYKISRSSQVKVITNEEFSSNYVRAMRSALVCTNEHLTQYRNFNTVLHAAVKIPLYVYNNGSGSNILYARIDHKRIE